MIEEISIVDAEKYLSFFCSIMECFLYAEETSRKRPIKALIFFKIGEFATFLFFLLSPATI